MAECPYCLETGNSFIATNLDPDNHFEVEVVACEMPYLRVRYYTDGWLANWKVGMRIKFCPMCGRRLSDG